jgi:hypothetical protein
MFGYDYVLSIEHEDSLMSPDEGLTKAAEFLNQWWFGKRLPLPGGSRCDVRWRAPARHAA